MKSSKEHWEQVYNSTSTDKLGWYQEKANPSIKLLKACKLVKDSRIINVGAGTSTFVDFLVAEGYQNLIITDISESAINQLKERLKDKADQLEWIIDDLTNAQDLTEIDQVDLWHDRAVLHFFNKPDEQLAYFDLLKKLVKPGGFVIIAVFALTGAKKCSGLQVKNYDASMLQERLGAEFILLKQFVYMYTTPSGNPRDYIYTLFQRV